MKLIAFFYPGLLKNGLIRKKLCQMITWFVQKNIFWWFLAWPVMLHYTKLFISALHSHFLILWAKAGRSHISEHGATCIQSNIPIFFSGNSQTLKCLLDWGGNTEADFFSLESKYLGRNPKQDELNSKSPMERLLVFEDGILMTVTADPFFFCLSVIEQRSFKCNWFFCQVKFNCNETFC